MKEYTAITKQDDEWWIGWIEEIPGMNCQERTHAELLESLRATLAEALAFNQEDASLLETAHLFGNRKNAMRLMQAIEDVEARRNLVQHELIDE